MLSYNKLMKLVENSNINSKGFELQVNSASIDVRLGKSIMIESPASSIIDPREANENHLTRVDLREGGILIRPQQIFLASTLEVLDLPNNIACDFILKSSIGRCFLNHLQSVHIDPGFRGPVTLELVNMNQQHSIRITPHMKIGQLRFFEVEPVPDFINYRNVGQYNTESEHPNPNKGVR